MPFDRAHYDLLVKHGLCPRCKGTPQLGRKFCKPCSQASTAYAKEWRKKNPGGAAKWARDQYERRRINGKCLRCGGERSARNYCKSCCEYSRIRARTGSRSKPHTCSMCKGSEQPLRHDRRSCPLRFKVDVIAYASARPGAGQ